MIYGGFKPQQSLLTIRHPLAGHALGLDDLVRGHIASNHIPELQRISFSCLRFVIA